MRCVSVRCDPKQCDAVLCYAVRSNVVIMQLETIALRSKLCTPHIYTPVNRSNLFAPIPGTRSHEHAPSSGPISALSGAARSSPYRTFVAPTHPHRHGEPETPERTQRYASMYLRLIGFVFLQFDDSTQIASAGLSTELGVRDSGRKLAKVSIRLGKVIRTTQCARQFVFVCVWSCENCAHKCGAIRKLFEAVAIKCCRIRCRRRHHHEKLVALHGYEQVFIISETTPTRWCERKILLVIILVQIQSIFSGPGFPRRAIDTNYTLGAVQCNAEWARMASGHV